MSSISTADTGQEKKQPGMIKNLFKRIAIILAIGLLVIAGVFAFNYSVKKAGDPGQVAMSSREIKQMLDKDTERIDLFVKSIQRIPKEIATILELQRLRKEEIKIVMESILLNSPELFGSAVAYSPGGFDQTTGCTSIYGYREEGAVRFTTLDDPEYGYFNKDWYLLPKILEQPVWVDPYFDEGGGGVFMTTYAVPFSFFDGVKAEFTGVVTVDVSIDWLTRFFNSGKILPRNGFVMLLSEDGTILSGPREEWVVNHTIFSLAVSLRVPELRKVGRALQKGGSGVTTVTSPTQDSTMKVFYSAVPANKWGILYIIPEKTGAPSHDHAGG